MKNALVCLAVLFALSGCEVPVMIAADKNQGKMTGMFEITFPAVMLVQRADGVEEILTGSLVGHASGRAKYDLSGPLSGQCTGAYTKDGQNTLTCASGFSYSENVGRQRAKMSGVNIATGSYEGVQFIGAFGWGNEATETAVRSAIDKYRLAQG